MPMLIEVVLLHLIHRLPNLPRRLLFIWFGRLDTRRIPAEICIIGRGGGENTLYAVVGVCKKYL